MLTVNHQFGILVLWQASPLQQNLQKRRMDGIRDMAAFKLKLAPRVDNPRRVVRCDPLANSAACMAILLRADGRELTIG